MAVLRLLAWVLLLVAMILLVGDLTRASTGGTLVFTSALALWKNIAPQLLAAFSNVIQRAAHPWLWDPVVMRVLLLPGWFLLGAVGAVLATLSRRKRRINIFAN